MSAKKFLMDDQGTTAIEYVIFVAGAGIILVVGVGILFNAMKVFFGSWATYFGG